MTHCVRQWQLFWDSDLSEFRLPTRVSRRPPSPRSFRACNAPTRDGEQNGKQWFISPASLPLSAPIRNGAFFLTPQPESHVPIPVTQREHMQARKLTMSGRHLLRKRLMMTGASSNVVALPLHVRAHDHISPNHTGS